MIKTFAALAVGAGTDASPLAGGVSQALLTTQAGLVVALPIVLAFRALESRTRRHIDSARLHARHLESALSGEGA
jgi:biopolymer transport protein ExbB